MPGVLARVQARPLLLARRRGAPIVGGPARAARAHAPAPSADAVRLPHAAPAGTAVLRSAASRAIPHPGSAVHDTAADDAFAPHRLTTVQAAAPVDASAAVVTAASDACAADAVDHPDGSTAPARALTVLG